MDTFISQDVVDRVTENDPQRYCLHNTCKRDVAFTGWEIGTEYETDGFSQCKTTLYLTGGGSVVVREERHNALKKSDDFYQTYVTRSQRDLYEVMGLSDTAKEVYYMLGLEDLAKLEVE
ncbi:hypothetical protein SAMN05660772_01868 [Pasteurella testudinis DSM 23072]|uniref:Uncharacterized protein n=1 Tax=Pasteurella testudinis DSM 23072 TaxID=1122938 RepID=A0A1W1UK72_9PAST|nr:hypothetical protein [Pasteurella testudinis]SMB81480.1 hypothetical protein SAMN05660772_01868 [Pasteurella testudinis DSM 23072]SUB51426.1 Uncharacterised protein [Pasteurella testudinis]